MLLLGTVALLNPLANQVKQLDTQAWVAVGAGLPVASGLAARRLMPNSVIASALGAVALLFVFVYLLVFLTRSLDNLLVLLFGNL